jgi:general stress protein 26
MTMEADELLRIAREIVSGVVFPVSITNGADGTPSARIVQTSPLSETWTFRFMTDSRSRKVAEIERSRRMAMIYQLDRDASYVTLVGNATINATIETKRAIWNPASLKWHPGGPEDPNVVLVEFATERIELWSSRHNVVPDPRHGLWATALTRKGASWRVSETLYIGAAPQIVLGRSRQT